MATPATISANIPCNQMVILMNDFTIQSNMLRQITKKKRKRNYLWTRKGQSLENGNISDIVFHVAMLYTSAIHNSLL